jgi:hypothetical protein
MHQITPPRTGGKYAERPCGDCKKTRHIAVGFSNSKQKATIIAGVNAEVDSKWAAPIWSQAEWDKAKTPSPANSSPPRSIAARAPSPPRSIAARTPSAPTIVKTPNDPFDNNATNDLLIAPHSGKWDPIANDSQITQEDTDRRRQEDIDCMLKRQHEQNERDMQDIPGYVARKERSYAKLYARERLLERQAEQRRRKAFKALPIGLPFTSEDWMRESDTWNKEHIPDWKEKRIIDIVSDDDRMESYYFEGKKLYRIPQRRPRRTDDTYEKEDRNLAASLSSSNSSRHG